MFSDSVDQKAIMAMSDGGKSFSQKLLPQPTVPASLRIGPKPLAWITIQMRRKTATARTNGAAQFSKRRTAFMPRRMIKMFSAQKMRKLSHKGHGWGAATPNPSD